MVFLFLLCSQQAFFNRRVEKVRVGVEVLVGVVAGVELVVSKGRGRGCASFTLRPLK